MAKKGALCSSLFISRRTSSAGNHFTVLYFVTKDLNILENHLVVVKACLKQCRIWQEAVG